MKVLNKGCHIVDATATVSEQDFFNLGLGTKYGKEVNGCWEKGMSKNIFPDEAAKSKLYHPDSIVCDGNSTDLLKSEVIYQYF